VTVDPLYALAYAALADTYSARAMFRDMPATEAVSRAREAAQRALILDPTLADAHIALAIVLERYDRDFQSAEREYVRALELDPANATAHHRYAMFLVSMRRTGEATAHFGRAIAGDPTSVIINLDAGRSFYCARDYARAEMIFRNAVDMDPHYYRSHALLAHCYAQMSKFDAAVTEVRTALALDGSGGKKYLLVYILAKAGKMQEARQQLAELESSPGAERAEPYFRPLAFAALGDTESAFASLKTMDQTHSPELLGLNSDPAWDILRDDPRFRALLRRLGFTPR
jgi:Tfp pilus assembly protein PilF